MASTVGWLLSVAAVLVWTVLLIRARRGIELMSVVEPLPRAPVDVPAVTAYVPARNEARVIAPCVTALVQQGAILDRLIVIDDRSTDGTRARLEALREEQPRIEVIDGRGPGPGECGKPAALRDAVHAILPEREWLLFLDADVILRPGALSGLLQVAAEREADLVTVFPQLELETPVERLVMPAIGALIAAIYPSDRVSAPDDPLAFANGQLILIRRSAYEAAGGHAAVASEILEDVRLAENVKRSGGVLCLADGRKIARTRMYESWSELVEGWSKNLFLLLGSNTKRAVAWALGSIVLSSIGWIALFAAGWPIGLVAWAFVLGVQMTLRKRGGAPPGWALLAPVGAVALAIVLLRSTWLHTRGREISWKGRRYGSGKAAALSSPTPPRTQPPAPGS